MSEPLPENLLYVSPKESIKNALKKMDDMQRKLLIVINDDGFVGLVSIGDIQRAILRSVPLSSSIDTIMRARITVSHEDESLDDIKEKMLTLRTEFMPILDNNMNLTKVIFWEDLFQAPIAVHQTIDLPVVIMAGGEGTRLRPITNVIPKPLVPIGSRTIAEDIIKGFVDAGCRRFFMTLNYRADFIEYYFNSIVPQKDYSLSFFREQKPLGTAGSLSLLKGEISETFLISNCDILIDQNIHEIYEYHKKYSNELTAIVAMKTIGIPYGMVETAEEGKLISLIEKPELVIKVNTGMYILEPHLIESVPTDRPYDMTDLIAQVLKRQGKVGAFPISEGAWKDIGTWAQYSQVVQTASEVD